MKSKNMSTTKKTITEQPPNLPPTTTGTPDDAKEPGQKYSLSKFEYDLYHEEDDKVEKVISVKRVSMPNKGEKWKISENGKVMFIIEGTKLTNKEKEFLRSIDGVNFLIAEYKQGIKSFNYIKNEIKKKLK